MSVASKLAILYLLFSLSLIVLVQLRMPRRERRLGTRYIEDHREREITLYKRRHGLSKGASDLSALTGANIAIILEKRDSGKMFSFGAPSVQPIVETFLSGYPQMGSFSDEEQKARIEWLQGEVNRLDKEIAMIEKRKKQSIDHAHEAQDSTSWTAAKHVFSNVEALNLEQLNMHLTELKHVEEDTRHRLPPLQRGKESEVSRLFMSQNVLEQGNPSSTISLPPARSLISPASHTFPLDLPSVFRQETVAPLYPVQIPPKKSLSHHSNMWEIQVNGYARPDQISMTPPSDQLMPHLQQPFPNQIHHQAPPQNYTSPYNPLEAPQNNAIPNNTFLNEQAPFSYHHSTYSLSDLPNSNFIGFDDEMDSTSGNAGLEGSGLLAAMMEPSSSMVNGSVSDDFHVL